MSVFVRELAFSVGWGVGVGVSVIGFFIVINLNSRADPGVAAFALSLSGILGSIAAATASIVAVSRESLGWPLNIALVVLSIPTTLATAAAAMGLISIVGSVASTLKKKK